VDTAPPTVDRPHHVRHVLAPMRVLLVVFAVLTAMAVVALFVLSGQTDQTFAWTIQPPLTAAFLGAGYAAGFVLVVLSLRDPVWAHSRVPVLTILAFVALTLVATLLHIDRFHFQPEFAAQPFIARAAAWFWLAVYVAVPVLMVVLLAPQERAPGADPVRGTRCRSRCALRWPWSRGCCWRSASRSTPRRRPRRRSGRGR
jgi:hypothetical protein